MKIVGLNVKTHFLKVKVIKLHKFLVVPIRIEPSGKKLNQFFRQKKFHLRFKRNILSYQMDSVTANTE